MRVIFPPQVIPMSRWRFQVTRSVVGEPFSERRAAAWDRARASIFPPPMVPECSPSFVAMSFLPETVGMQPRAAATVIRTVSEPCCWRWRRVCREKLKFQDSRKRAKPWRWTGVRLCGLWNMTISEVIAMGKDDFLKKCGGGV